MAELLVAFNGQLMRSTTPRLGTLVGDGDLVMFWANKSVRHAGLSRWRGVPVTMTAAVAMLGSCTTMEPERASAPRDSCVSRVPGIWTQVETEPSNAAALKAMAQQSTLEDQAEGKITFGIVLPSADDAIRPGAVLVERWYTEQDTSRIVLCAFRNGPFNRQSAGEWFVFELNPGTEEATLLDSSSWIFQPYGTPRQ